VHLGLHLWHAAGECSLFTIDPKGPTGRVHQGEGRSLFGSAEGEDVAVGCGPRGSTDVRVDVKKRWMTERPRFQS